MDNLFSHEAEQNVLGALLFSDRAWDIAGDLLTAEDFVREDHAAIFGAIASLAEAGKPIDAVTVAAHLGEHGLIDMAGGSAYIGELVASMTSMANVKHYAEIVRDRAQLRRLAIALKAGEGVIANPDLSLAEKVGEITQGLETVLTKGLPADEPVDAKAAGLRWVEALTQRAQAGGSITGFATGFPELDKLIRGLNRKHLLVIAARPSVGKTTLATNILRHVLHSGHGAFLATMEMSVEDVMNQLCACHTGCSYEALQEARLADESLQAATGAFSAALRSWRLTIDDRGTQTLSSIRRSLKRHMRLNGNDTILVVDYAQLVSHKAENEAVRIGEISRGMKEIAQDLDIPVILVSQLNRETDKRGGDSRPRLVDLKGSGGLEQDASEVFLLHDEAANDPNKQSEFIEVIVAKNRHGRRNVTVKLGKQLDRARFVTPAPGSYDDWKCRQAGEQQEPRRTI